MFPAGPAHPTTSSSTGEGTEAQPTASTPSDYKEAFPVEMLVASIHLEGHAWPQPRPSLC